MVLQHCSVFAGGFDLAAAITVVVGEAWDEYAVLDLLDSLVRKSLVTAERVGDGTRYGLLETIRQFAEDQLAAATGIDTIRDRHARYYADQSLAHFDMWDGPGYRAAIDWLDAEFANLRAGFRWATDQGDLVTATAIAASTALMAFALNRFEPVGWAEELLPAATTADVPQLPRLYTAAAQCSFVGRPEAGLEYAERALALEADSRYEPLPAGWSRSGGGQRPFGGRQDGPLRGDLHRHGRPVRVRPRHGSGLADVWPARDGTGARGQGHRRRRPGRGAPTATRS